MPKKLKLKYIKEKTSKIKKGYNCISKKYKNNKEKLEFLCDNNHIFLMTWNNFLKGVDCTECTGRKKFTIDDIISKIKSIDKSYNCLSKTYTYSIKLKLLCGNSHIFYMLWNDFRKGSRCPICSFKKRGLSRRGKNHPNWKGGVKKKDISLYNTYANKIKFCEKVREDPKNHRYLQVKCTNSKCKKWFNPKGTDVRLRIQAINGKAGGREGRFYCSDRCKQSCSIFGQKKYPKGFISEDKIRLDQKEWANMVKERDNHECQKCGSTEGLIAHHIEGLNVNPLMSADIDLGITLCKKCDKKVHSDIGCRYVDLTKQKLCGGLK